MIAVFSRPGCVQCIATGRALTSKGLREGEGWEYRDLTLPENAAALEWVMEDLGYKQAPIVVVDDETHWSGFRPDLIARVGTEGGVGVRSVVTWKQETRITTLPIGG